jgi:hypothetical protein
MTQAGMACGIFAIAVATTACVPLTLRAEHRPVGLGMPRTAKPSVASPDQVLVFHQNAPDGFTLRENELKVEAGYAHLILGTVEVHYASGYCHVVDDYMPNADFAVQRIVREQAFRSGANANAVIYFESALRPNAPALDLTELCKSRNHVGSAAYATGWFVVVAARPAAPAPAPVTATPIANPVPNDSQDQPEITPEAAPRPDSAP